MFMSFMINGPRYELLQNPDFRPDIHFSYGVMLGTPQEGAPPEAG